MVRPLMERLSIMGFARICHENGELPHLNLRGHVNGSSKRTSFELYAYNGVGVIVSEGRHIVDLFSVFKGISSGSEEKQRYWRGATIPENTELVTDNLGRDLRGFQRVCRWNDSNLYEDVSFNDLAERMKKAGLLYKPI